MFFFGSKAPQRPTVCHQDPMEGIRYRGRTLQENAAREVKRNVWYSIDDQEIKESVCESFYDIVPQDVLIVIQFIASWP